MTRDSVTRDGVTRDGVTRGAVAVVLGALIVRLVVTGGYLVFVKPAMHTPLLLGGIGLGVLGLWSLVGSVRSARVGGEAEGHDAPHHAHDEGREDDHVHTRNRTAPLILVPIAVLAVGSPFALGADMVASARRAPAPTTFAANDSGRTSAPGVTRSNIPVVVNAPANGGSGLSDVSVKPIAPEGTTVDRKVNQFAGEASLWPGLYEGVTVRLVGFVSGSAESAKGFQLARFRLVCCAADALVAVTDVVGKVATDNPHDVDTWVSVEGTLDPASTKESVRLVATRIRVIDQPLDPYE